MVDDESRRRSRRRSSRAHEPTSTDAGYLAQLREGWDFLRGDRVLLGIAVMVALTNLIDIAWATVLVPVWAKETGGGAAAIGLVFAVFSGASALGAVCAAVWGDRLPRYRTYLIAFLVCGAPAVRGDGARQPALGGAGDRRGRRLRVRASSTRCSAR